MATTARFFVAPSLRTLYKLRRHCPEKNVTNRCPRLATVRRERRGVILILTALLLTVLIGITALAIDYGNAADYRHRMQSAADAAAIAGARELKRNPSITNAQIELFVRHDAALNGFTQGVNSIAVSSFHNPSSGPFVANPKYVEVKISRPLPTFFLALFGRPTISVAVRAVAGQAGGSSGCIYNLGASPTAFQTSGGGFTIDVRGCDIYDNGGLKVSAGWTINANSINVAGFVDNNSCSGCVTAITPLTTPVSDPYASLPEPLPGTCLTLPDLTNSTVTMSPGTYCSDIAIGQSRVTFQSGLYILKGNFSITGGTSVVTNTTGGVTFFLIGPQNKTVDFSAGTITLSAPTTGPYATILFASRLQGPSDKDHFESDFMTLNGVFYFPHQHIEWKGNGTADYTILVCDNMKFTGGSSLNSNFSSLPGGVPGRVSKAE